MYIFFIIFWSDGVFGGFVIISIHQNSTSKLLSVRGFVRQTEGCFCSCSEVWISVSGAVVLFTANPSIFLDQLFWRVSRPVEISWMVTMLPQLEANIGASAAKLGENGSHSRQCGDNYFKNAGISFIPGCCGLLWPMNKSRKQKDNVESLTRALHDMTPKFFKKRVKILP